MLFERQRGAGQPALADTQAATAICSGTDMITEQQDSFISSLDGIPTPEQAAQLLEMGEGDTATADNSSAPTAAPELDVNTNSDAGKTDTNQALAEDALNADNAVILAKDGKHTIGFEKLVEARQSAQQYKQMAEAAHVELQRLQAEAQARAAAGQSATTVDTQVATAQAAIDAGVDPVLFGDFSEEQMADGIQKLVDSLVGQQMAAFEQSLQPIRQQQQNDAANAHYNAIYEKHPDADSLAESQELVDWIAAQPSFVQDNYKAVLDNGTTSQVIELFDRFKSATDNAAATAQSQPSIADLKAKANAVVASATNAPPVSLTDIPGGRPSGATREEAMATMTGPEMLEQMASMNSQQIESFLNRSL